MSSQTSGCCRHILCKQIEQVKFIHEMLDHWQHIDLLEPGFKLRHNTPSGLFNGGVIRYFYVKA
jgi:hypothetical protein